MPITSSMVGRSGAAVTDVLEDRWVMNYAAGVGDTNPLYFDNTGSEPLPAHAAYVSHLEWDAIGALYGGALSEVTEAERVLGVHTANSTRIARPLVAGDTLTATATVVGVQAHRAGAHVTLRIDTVDEAGAVVATSHTATIFRGLPVDADAPAPASHLDAGTRPGAEPIRVEQIEIGRLAPFVFSECARDYGVIHTDIKVATEASLPGLILHGTGTIAYVLSSLTNHEAKGDPRLVRGFEMRLTGMVLCPSTMTLRVYAGVDGDTIHFDAITESGATALADGVLILGEPE